MPTQLLIDGHSLLFRAYHALSAQNLQAADGTPTGAIHGFLAMVLKVIGQEHPDRVIIAYDGPHKTFRHAQYAEYKGTRKEAPDDFRVQVPLALEIASHLGIPTIMVDGYEADDVIGTLSDMGRARHYRTLIVTGDRDLLQLVDDDTTVLLTSRTGISDMDRMDAQKVEEKLGVAPVQVPDLKGLMGDSSDNIPGVKGIGEQSARELIRRYGSVDNLLEHVDTLDNTRWIKALKGHEEDARTSRDLATIIRDVPLQWPDVAEPFTPAPDAHASELLNRLALHAIERRLGQAPRSADEVATAAEQTVPHAVTRHQERVLWSQLAANPKYLVVHSDDTGIWVMDPEGHMAPWQNEPWPDVPLWTWDSKALYHKIRALGERCPDFAEDGQLQAYLLDAERGHYDLASVAQSQDIVPPRSTEEVLAVAETLIAKQRQAVAAQGLDDLYRRIEVPLSRVLADMESVGMRVDRQQLALLGQELDGSLVQIQADIYQLAGTEFNINSPQQLGEVLFGKLGLPSTKKTKSGSYATDADTLEKIAPLHPVVEHVLLYRQLMKIKGTYVDGLLPLIGSDERVHTTFHQTGTATGRLSSSDPNLQNIPVRLPLGRRVRSVFVPSPHRILIAADYSQIELRLLAHLSGDEHLIEAFWHGEDIHRRTAAEIFNIPFDEVDSTWRSRAKAVNFGIVYGISDFGLARDTGVSQREAKDYIARYFARYPKLKEYFDRVIESAREEGLVRTIMGRIRPLRDIHSKNRARRQYAERMAMNTAIQGSAADLIKIAMVNLGKRLRQESFQSQLVLQVHDELIWDATEEEKYSLARLAKEYMTSAMQLKVPLEVEFKQGTTWESMTSWEIPDA
ncbi:MAG: DNA polymerase I [Sulfobacillus thermotolerans]|uniref:DNA polymerase I n=1 Tax=Sulfobacillus thermotolerans TaxID=338644 RepID=A0ABM6RPK6_9FIRM|nr:DNA polymerase I [Sulfobacillus thermotolerans]MCY0907373.1 DNA polymerase I [Sulfobacillus thermotolerans]